jgi:hypothetical protein
MTILDGALWGVRHFYNYFKLKKLILLVLFGAFDKKAVLLVLFGAL